MSYYDALTTPIANIYLLILDYVKAKLFTLRKNKYRRNTEILHDASCVDKRFCEDLLGLGVKAH